MNYASMPLAAHPLNEADKARLLLRIDDLLKFLGAPGDWGYSSKLGTITVHLLALRKEIMEAA